MADNPPLPLYRVLIQEYNAQRGHLPAAERLDESVYDTQYETLKQSYRARLHDSEEAAKRANADLVKMFYARMRGDGVKRSALCFSGGGIRSATFGLGVLQGLSRRGLLSEFDYLSTVSGGGYLGGWLSAWIHRHGLYAVQEGLRNQATAKKSPLNPEPEPIRHLRSYSRYMSPKLGLLSADTWTLAAIYFRNLLLNWIVLLPLIMAAMMLPRLALWAISPHVRAALKTNSWGGTLSQLAFWGAVAFGAYAVAYIYANRPSYGEPALYGGVKKRASVFPEPRKRQTIFLAECLTPLILLAILITTYYAWIDVPLGDMEFDFLGRSLHWPAPVAFVVFGVLLNVVGWLIAFLWIRVFGISELLIAAATGALGGFLTWAITYVFFPDPLTLQSSAIYVCVAMPLFLLLFLLAATVFVGLSSYRTTDNDREWLARCGAWMLIACAVWSVVSALVIFGPVLFAALGPKMRTTLASVSGISGLLTLVFGRSGKSPANSKEEQKGGLLAGAGNLSLSLAAAIFSAAAIVLLSIITTWLINKIGVNLSPTLAGRGLIDAPMRDYWYATGSFLPYDPLGQLNFLEASPLWLLVPLTLLLVVLGGVAGLFININKFSLHAAYRDRLVRAYLGASRDESERKPNPFTGLDENDNLPMDALRNQYFFDEYSFSNFDAFASELEAGARKAAGAKPLSPVLAAKLSPPTRELLLKNWRGDKKLHAELQQAVVADLNLIIREDSLYDGSLFKADTLSEEIKEMLGQRPFTYKASVPRFNRRLLENAYPEALGAQMCRPMHVVNMTLNLVGGDKLAWQDRKAESFTVSALHSGSYCVGYRDSSYYAYNKSAKRAISLGTSVAISGAAASPNMGYHSSPFVTFLLTLFNVRLGWWLGNPGVAGADTYFRPGPYFAPKPILAEAFGMTSDRHPYVYLSDGGHFENLGLYEMIIRRCHYIVVSDGSADPEYNFESLGSAISKIRVDFGIPINFDKVSVLKKPDQTERGYGMAAEPPLDYYCAVATICYSCVDDPGVDASGKKIPVENGTLIYIKAALHGTEAVDVFNYALAHGEFPHESTGDQFYSEEQFESYRELGSHTIDRMLELAKQSSPPASFPQTIEDFIESLEGAAGVLPDCE